LHAEATTHWPNGPELPEQTVSVFVNTCNRERCDQAVRVEVGAKIQQVREHIAAARKAANSLARALPVLLAEGTVSTGARNSITALARELRAVAEELTGHDDLPRLTAFQHELDYLKRRLPRGQNRPTVQPEDASRIRDLLGQLDWVRKLLAPSSSGGGQHQQHVLFGCQIAITYAHALAGLGLDVATTWAQPTSPIARFALGLAALVYGDIHDYASGPGAVAKAVRRELEYELNLERWRISSSTRLARVDRRLSLMDTLGL
jgi:hypothetical protein